MSMTLMIVKLITGETLLTELFVDKEHSRYAFLNPLVLVRVQTQEGETTIAIQYMPGMFDDVIFVRFDSVITLCEASHFYRKLYGSALFRAYIQHESQQMTAVGGKDTDDKFIEKIKLKEVEILAHYGMIDEEEADSLTTGLLH